MQADYFLTPDFWRETRNEARRESRTREAKKIERCRQVPPGSEVRSTAVRPHKKQDRANKIRKAFDFDRTFISIIEVETSASIASQTHFRHIVHQKKLHGKVP